MLLRINFLFLSTILSINCVYDIQNKENLTMSLLENYNSIMRPSEYVLIIIQPELNQILSIDEKNQIMSSSFVMHLSWNDTRLSWNYDKIPIETITIPANKIWIPDLYILNSLDESGFLKIDDFLTASVLHNGQIIINIPWTALETRCNLNIKYFPFDKQTCDFNVTLWNLQSHQYDFFTISDSIFLQNYRENSIWSLTKSEFGRDIEKYGRWSWDGFYQQ